VPGVLRSRGWSRGFGCLSHSEGAGCCCERVVET
jgi:hypothetical protein